MFHSNFARSYLTSHQLLELARDNEHRDVLEFAADYFAFHDILAATALPSQDPPGLWPENTLRLSNSTIESLAGCSPGLLSLIDRISRLASTEGSITTYEDRNSQRDTIERCLFELSEPALDLDDEKAVILETKRLAALIYLYSRIDNAGPQQPQIERLSTRVLELMPQIAFRTNALLWPLFIVATLGLRPECDEERLFILERLSALQDTRRLGNVQKARELIEDVWKARDLSRVEAVKGWTILRDKDGTVSLA